MHLIMCTTFSSTANKFEFLNMAYHLIDRLTALVSFIIQRIHSNLVPDGGFPGLVWVGTILSGMKPNLYQFE